MARGDHIFVRRGRGRYYTHHGIDGGDGTVIHYTGTAATGRRVERSSLESFADGGEIFLRSYRSRLPAEEIVSRAESRLGTSGYHLVRNNCEHFATWASTGSAASRQVRSWAVAAPGAVASVAMAQAAGIHLIVLGTVSMCAYALRGLWFRRSGSRTLALPVDIDRDCAA
ncbi:lecithin retinol acyltransferase family protein [Nocardioides sp. NPDC126508]